MYVKYILFATKLSHERNKPALANTVEFDAFNQAVGVERLPVQFLIIDESVEVFNNIFFVIYSNLRSST
jgi:hypothetical protein